MQKTIKKMLAAALAVTLCVTMLPAQAVQAETTVDDTQLTDEQLKEAYFGEWDFCCTISEEEFTYYTFEDMFNEEEYFEEKWTFTGSEILEGVPMSSSEYEDLNTNGILPKSKIKVLIFESEKYEFRIRQESTNFRPYPFLLLKKPDLFGNNS